MDVVTLRRAGGSLTLTIPSRLVREMGLEPGARLAVTSDGARIVAEPVIVEQPRYTLDALLAQCDQDAPLSEEDRLWLGDPPTGAEVI